ncbi:MAG: hypothetical protein QME42_11555 [bacterium]|nr:hypothetical protein [bacterium]
MKISFDYRKEKSKILGIIYRPVAEVGFYGTNGRLIYEYMYIDSGADFTLIPYKVGKFLGLKEGEVEEIAGVNGMVGVIFNEISLVIGKYKFPTLIAWAQIEHVPFLLGRRDVFSIFDITFQERNKKVIFDWKG